MELKELLKNMSDSVNIGGINEAINLAGSELSKICRVMNFNDGSLVAFIDKNCEQTILLDAHIDQVGMIVTKIAENGFIYVAGAGGLDNRMLAGTPVTIHGKHKVAGVFCSTPPHLSKGKESEPKKVEEIAIDVGIENAQDVISLGDRVTFKQTAKDLINNRLSGASLDNRAGVVALIETARLIADIPCKYNVAVLLSDQEELGLRGAKIKAYGINPDEAIVVDVGFGDSPDIEKDKTSPLGAGAAIAMSPILSKKITNGLITAAKVNDIKYKFEVMGGVTSTNADEISVIKEGIPTALVSIPLRNMHTPVEIIDVEDVKSVARLLAAYIKE